MGEHDEITNHTTGDSRFFDLLLELAGMHSAKSNDYGLNDDEDDIESFIAADPLFNFRGSVLFGVDPWIGCMIRLGDKYSRLQTLAAGNELQNENARDTFLDLASYAHIALLLFEDDMIEDEEVDADPFEEGDE